MPTSRPKGKRLQQLTREEAIAFEEWKKWTLPERAAFQLRQDRLCMPFSEFHAAVENALGRPVFTHEFVDSKRLIDELDGKRKAPTLKQIMSLLKKYKGKVVAVVITEKALKNGRKGV